MIKELDDYLDIICAKHHRMKREDVKRILEYGFRMFDSVIRNGGDILVRDHRFWASAEKQFMDHLNTCKYNSYKERKKLRTLYRVHYEKYDGKYYFGMPEEEFKKIESKVKKHREITFENVRLWKIKEEAYLHRPNQYFFVIRYPLDMGWKFEKDKLKTKNYRLIAIRDKNKQIVEINGEHNKSNENRTG